LEYRDMEFWSDGERAVYRPQYTVEELRAWGNFEHRPGMLVEAFEQRPEGEVEVISRSLSTGRRERIAARRLVLAAGTLGTARVVLRSLGYHGRRVPLVCNPYVYLACLNWRLIGKPARERRHSLCQLLAYVDLSGSGGNVLQAQLYSYRSLLNFRLIKESPLAYQESIRLARLAHPYLVTINVYHADRPGPEKHLELQRELNETGDGLHVTYRLARDVERDHRTEERRVAGFFRRVGCLPLRVVRPVHGASIHYAGCLPMAKDDHPLTTRPSGQLREAPSVYLADGSVFPDLPAKGLTFTLMANANRVGSHLRDELLALKTSGGCLATGLRSVAPARLKAGIEQD
jgi:hypothetical protein